MGAFISIICSKIGCQEKNLMSNDESPIEAKQYSWDKREKVDPKDFTIENLDGETVGRLPGTINGQQFIIQKCVNCKIFLYDNIATISVDDCVNCQIFIGPVKTSVFIRDCTNCQLMLSCQQFRTRDCKKLDVKLACVSQPIIEASTNIKFACYSFYYPQLKDQFKSAGLTVYNNNWSNIHDFTPVADVKNFSLNSDVSSLEKFKCCTGMFHSMDITLDGKQWVVPRTYSKHFSDLSFECIVVFFHTDNIHERVEEYIKIMSEESNIQLVLTKETIMQTLDASNIFDSDIYNTLLQKGPVIALEYSSSEDCTRACQLNLNKLKQANNPVYISQNSQMAKRLIESIVGYSDMQMGF